MAADEAPRFCDVPPPRHIIAEVSSTGIITADDDQPVMTRVTVFHRTRHFMSADASHSALQSSLAAS